MRCISKGFDQRMVIYRMAVAIGITFEGLPEFVGDDEVLIRVIADGVLMDNSRTLKMKSRIRNAFFNDCVRIGCSRTQSGMIGGARNPADLGTRSTGTVIFLMLLVEFTLTDVTGYG
uniref:Uncharacterized protein n=1 Tax=Aureoumbra lagunensis TaxID=44058 RepID=A0A7S3JXN1_9STRA